MAEERSLEDELQELHSMIRLLGLDQRGWYVEIGPPSRWHIHRPAGSRSGFLIGNTRGYRRAPIGDAIIVFSYEEAKAELVAASKKLEPPR